MSTAHQNKLTLAYEGSVKRVWQCPWDEDSLLFEFSDDYSVFDWGKMPDLILNKGRALSLMGALFFDALERPRIWRELFDKVTGSYDAAFLKSLQETELLKSLERDGLASHFRGLKDENGEKLSLEKAAQAKTAFMEVRKAEVLRPSPCRILNQSLFDYPVPDAKLKTRLVPLEVVFRFGMPSGSSLKARLQKDPSYAGVLGLKQMPEEGKLFDRPVLEFYTKLEPKDRLLSLQEALLVSGLNEASFKELACLAQLAALALSKLFAEKNIELWDGKFEFILHEGKILLADSIGPDELRLLYKGVHLSKEMIRQVYRESHWEKSLKKAQELAGKRGTLDWKSICREELKAEPEPLSPPAKNIIDKLYSVLANHLSGKELFASQPSLDQFVSSARSLSEPAQSKGCCG